MKLGKGNFTFHVCKILLYEQTMEIYRQGKGCQNGTLVLNFWNSIDLLVTCTQGWRQIRARGLYPPVGSC